MTGWLFSLCYVLVFPLVFLVLGPLADDFAVQHFHLALGWMMWVVLLAFAPLALTLCWASNCRPTAASFWAY